MSRACADLLEALLPLDLRPHVGAQLLEGVELARHLRELVVEVGQLALLDGEDGDGDLRLLALVVAAEQRRLEGRRLARGEGLERLVDALDQLAGAELVGDRVRGVDLLVADRGDEVDLHEVAGLRRALDGDEGAEAAAQLVELLRRRPRR